MSHRKRQKKFVDARVQGAMARRIIFHWLLFVAVALCTAFIFQVLSNPFLPLALHLENLWWAQGPFIMVLVFLLPVFVLDTIKLSHRFAGPISRLRSAMRAIASGESPKKVSFRGGDFWQDLADDYNKMLDVLAKDSVREEDDKPEKELTLAGSKAN